MTFIFSVDTREPAKAKAFALDKYENAQLEALKAGDYACKVKDKYLIGIERKDLMDFVNAVSSKRIFKQIEKLHNQYPVVILALEGSTVALRANMARLHLKFNEKAFWGTIASIVVRDNFQIIWTSSQAETINMSYMICTKMYEGKYKLPRRWKPKSKNTPVDLLGLIPGITTPLAKYLLKKYKTIVDIGLQTQKELLTNKGIGTSVAKQIKRYLR